MSSLPHPEGVVEVVKLLADVDALESEAAKLRPMAQRLHAVEAELREHRKRLPGLLQSMDLAATGHFGWEGRMGWFLAEMRRQLVARANCDGCAKIARHPGEGYTCILHDPPKLAT